jgi:hypothetical protein
VPATAVFVALLVTGCGTPTNGLDLADIPTNLTPSVMAALGEQLSALAEN